MKSVIDADPNLRRLRYPNETEKQSIQRAGDARRTQQFSGDVVGRRDQECTPFVSTIEETSQLYRLRPDHDPKILAGLELREGRITNEEYTKRVGLWNI